MTTDLVEYYKNITYINKDVAVYEDNEGNYFNVSPVSLFVGVQYNKLNQKQYEQAVFNQIVPKDMICKEIEITEVVPKSEITKKEKDQFTLVDKKVKGREFWLVQNSMGMKKAYPDKESALKQAKEINKKIFEVCEVEIYK